MKKYLMLTLVLLAMAEPVFAFRLFDGNRKGFILEGNFGGGMTTVYSDYYVKEQVTRGAVNIELKFGYGGSNRYQIFMINKIAIIDASKMSDDYGNYFDKMSGDDLGAVFYIMVSPFVLPFIPYASSHSLLGFGGDYYFNDTAPSYFIGGAFGGSFMYNQFRDETDGGAGFLLGGGYEFQEHFQVRFDILYGFTSENRNDSGYQPIYDTGPEPKTRALSLLLTFGIHGY